MMVFTAKLNRKTLFIVGAVIAAVLLVLLWPSKKTDISETPAFSASTNESRLEYIQKLGWEVSETPNETQEIVIPAEKNEIFDRYNELQKAQGYDLNKYAGKIAKRYVYEIKNHPDSDRQYLLTLLICKDKVIGGDVASTNADGKMYPMQFPQNYSNT